MRPGPITKQLNDHTAKQIRSEYGQPHRISPNNQLLFPTKTRPLSADSYDCTDQIYQSSPRPSGHQFWIYSSWTRVKYCTSPAVKKQKKIGRLRAILRKHTVFSSVWLDNTWSDADLVNRGVDHSNPSSTSNVVTSPQGVTDKSETVIWYLSEINTFSDAVSFIVWSSWA